MKVREKTKAITVIHNYEPYYFLFTNICISKQTLISELTRQFAFTQIQKISSHFNRPNIGSSAVRLVVILIDGETEAGKIN